MRTINSPAVILPEDAPHPHSYRPDLPLRSELRPSLLEEEREAELEEVKDSSYETGYDNGRRSALDEARETVAAEMRTLVADNAALRAELAKKAS